MLISLDNVHLAFGEQVLLDGASLSIDSGERVCVVGRNGTGKSTLLDVLAGQRTVDDGRVSREPQLRIASLPQEAPADLPGTIAEVTMGGLGQWHGLVDAYQHEAANGADGAALARLQAGIETAGGWDLERRVEQTLQHLSLDPEVPFEALSGGMKRRALLARALVSDPHVLLLDEPTNHLDIETTEWLEDVLLGWPATLVFVTHDRRFMARLATRIVELDRGQLTSWPGNLENYQRRRAERLAAEERQNAEFDRKLAEEERWVRQGIKARRTRNEGRVRRLQDMRRQRAERRSQPGQASISVANAERSGTRVFEALDISFGWSPDTPIVANFSTLIERGDRLGIVGPNGSGKTTLLNLLLGNLAPTHGQVRHGTRLEVAFLDQHRGVLDDNASVRASVADGDDYIDAGDGRRHVIGYLQEFLFTPAQCNSRVRTLSGGERARLVLARLFAQPSNVLVLDEPTNDLDVETLELLEEQVANYPGTVLVVSHDREFLDNTVTTLLVMEGNAVISEHVGGWSDWQARRAHAEAPATPAAASARPRAATAAPAAGGNSRQRKLGHKQQRELAALPERIESLDADIEALQLQLADPELYRDAAADPAALSARLRELESERDAAWARWEQLEPPTR